MNEKSKFICLRGSPGEASAHHLVGGTTVLHAPSGTFIHAAGENDLSLTVPTITGVAVADWAAVAESRQERDETTWTQHLHFHGGGRATVVCDHLGGIDSVVTERVNAFTCFSGLVILSPY